MATAAALASALLYALASVLQHHSAEAVPESRSLRPGLLVALAMRPAWMVGVLADGGAYVLQFVALGHGSLVLVQPLLVSGLLFTLPMGAIVSHRRPSGREWVASAAVVVGLALFLLVAAPGPGRGEASASAWVLTFVATVAPVVVMIAAAGPRGGVRRASLLAAAAGLLSALAAAVTLVTAMTLRHVGLAQTLASWEPYALAVCGFAALLLVQSAFQAGPLRWSLPMLTVTESVAGVIIGVLLFGEQISNGPAAILLECLALSVMAAGVFAVGRSRLVVGADDQG